MKGTKLSWLIRYFIGTDIMQEGCKEARTFDS